VKIKIEREKNWEIREICLEMLRIMKKQAPIVFWDFQIDEKKKVAFRKEY
jgi:thymidylate synthase ThyX